MDESRSLEPRKSEAGALVPGVRVHSEKAMTKEMKSEARVHGFPASEFLPIKASNVAFPFLNPPFHAAHD